MSPPLHFSPGQHFDCSMCGKCCGGWRIVVDAESRAKIRGTALELRVKQESGGLAFKRRGDSMETAQNSDGRCVFLNAQQLCSIQAELGPECKPQGCHKFPFQFTRTPDGVFVGMSFCCVAARSNRGRDLKVHGDSILAMLDQEQPVGREPMPVHRKVTMEWPAYRVLEELVSANLALDGALAGLSALVARAGRAVNLTSEDLRSALTRAYDFELQAKLAEPFFATLIGYLEVDTADGLPAFQQAILADREVTFRRFQDWTGQPHQVEAAGQLEPWAQAELDRYLKSLLFRKFLVTERPIQHNLSILYMLPRLFRFCAGLSRLSRGSETLDLEDVHRALDECEYTFITHATTLDRTCAKLGQVMVGMFDGPTPRRQKRKQKSRYLGNT